MALLLTVNQCRDNSGWVMQPIRQKVRSGVEFTISVIDLNLGFRDVIAMNQSEPSWPFQ